MALADTIAGAAIALVGSFVSQSWIDRRSDVRAYRERQRASMIEVHQRMTKFARLTLEYAKRVRESKGQDTSGSMELMEKLAYLRLEAELLDDETMRELSEQALDHFANLAKAIEDSAREEAAQQLAAGRKAIDDLAARIGENTRAERPRWWGQRRTR